MMANNKGRAENFEGKRTGRPRGIRTAPKSLSVEQTWLLKHLQDKKAEHPHNTTWTSKLRWIQESASNKSYFMKHIMDISVHKGEDEAEGALKEPVVGLVDRLLAEAEREEGKFQEKKGER